jgi:D-glycero-alpha-D-manno-heptose-7-phosphate kinase
MIITKTPYRVSMFGGGTDHPKWFNEFGGSVVSFSIDKYCFINLRVLPAFFEHKFRVIYSKVETVNEVEEILHPAVRHAFREYGKGNNLELQHNGDLPARSGVGSSSAFVVGLIKALYALNGDDISNFNLASKAIDFEQNILGETVGSQDQIACAIGGVNFIDFSAPNNWNLTQINLSQEYLKDFESRMILVYSGVDRSSSEVSKTLLQNLKAKQSILHRTRELALEFKEILSTESSLDLVDDLMLESWTLKKKSNPVAINPKLDNIYEYAINQGALGGKILGAGGGGFFLFWLKPGHKETFAQKMAPMVNIPFTISSEGCTQIL